MPAHPEFVLVGIGTAPRLRFFGKRGDRSEILRRHRSPPVLTEQSFRRSAGIGLVVLINEQIAGGDRLEHEAGHRIDDRAEAGFALPQRLLGKTAARDIGGDEAGAQASLRRGGQRHVDPGIPPARLSRRGEAAPQCLGHPGCGANRKHLDTMGDQMRRNTQRPRPHAPQGLPEERLRRCGCLLVQVVRGVWLACVNDDSCEYVRRVAARLGGLFEFVGRRSQRRELGFKLVF
jgi:hypothetical protein